MKNRSLRLATLALLSAAAVLLLGLPHLRADGMIMRPAAYQGSLEERAQEAIIIFNAAPPRHEGTEDLILKIRVEGEVSQFAWVVPFPSQPTVKKADEKLFRELYDYVAWRTRPVPKAGMKGSFGGGGMGAAEKPVEVLSREVVGSYDVAVVRENQAGALNKWLATEGYHTVDDGEEVIEFYRKKNYVFSCVKVTEANLKAHAPADLHPLRFTFTTGGRDGIYFPMKMTGLQQKPFDVNLYVFYQWWLNDNLNRYGYEHRGFERKYRDWDGPQCVPNGGKFWARPTTDPFLRDAAGQIKTLAAMFRELHPRDRYYLTNLRASQLKPAEVRKWADDLWLFPYYLDKRMVPYDARPGGPAAAAYGH